VLYKFTLRLLHNINSIDDTTVVHISTLILTNSSTGFSCHLPILLAMFKYSEIATEEQSTLLLSNFFVTGLKFLMVAIFNRD